LLEHYVGDTSVADTNADDAATPEPEPEPEPADTEAAAPDDAIIDGSAPTNQGLDPADYPLGAESSAARIEPILEQDGGQPSETAPGDNDG
jgi:hypothetical protein